MLRHIIKSTLSPDSMVAADGQVPTGRQGIWRHQDDQVQSADREWPGLIDKICQYNWNLTNNEVTRFCVANYMIRTLLSGNAEFKTDRTTIDASRILQIPSIR